jgi:hypothetical protein
MGICEASNKNKDILFNQQFEGCQKVDDENSNNKETHTSSENSKENKTIKNSEIIKSKCPELTVYDNSGKKSEFSHLNNKTASVFSSGCTEEEFIIRGEINKNCKNKEEDFDNKSFKRLVEKNGGIIIKKNDKRSTISYSSNGIDSLLGFGKDKIEIKSIHTLPINSKNAKILINDKKSKDLLKYNKSENNKSLINDRISKFLNENNNNPLRQSNKINVSMNDNYPYLSIPKTDEPLPDIDELSNESPIILGRNSLISAK